MRYFFALLIFFTLAGPVAAHVLKTDSTIGAVIHIDPEDNPIVGQPATFYLTFRDTTERFTMSECDCQANILQAGRSIQMLPVELGDSSQEGTIAYTFPARGVYRVEIIGRPNTPNAFDPFTLKYDLRIERTESGSKDDSLFHTIHYCVIIGAMVIAAAGAVIQSRRRKPLGQTPKQ